MVDNHKRKGVTFIALRADGRVLMQLRDNRAKLYPNMWTFPGGECDFPEEDPIDAAVREAHEEFNLLFDKREGEFLMYYQAPYDEDKDLTEYVFIFPVRDDQKPVLKEGAGMEWMNLEEIENAEVGFGKKEIILPKLKGFLTKRKKM